MAAAPCAALLSNELYAGGQTGQQEVRTPTDRVQSNQHRCCNIASGITVAYLLDVRRHDTEHLVHGAVVRCGHGGRRRGARAAVTARRAVPHERPAAGALAAGAAIAAAVGPRRGAKAGAKAPAIFSLWRRAAGAAVRGLPVVQAAAAELPGAGRAPQAAGAAPVVSGSGAGRPRPVLAVRGAVAGDGGGAIGLRAPPHAAQAPLASQSASISHKLQLEVMACIFWEPY